MSICITGITPFPAGLYAEEPPVMLVGGGKITYYLARQLIEDGIQVKIIEMNKTRCEELSELLPSEMYQRKYRD